MSSSDRDNEVSREKLQARVDALRARAKRAESALSQVHHQREELPWCEDGADEPLAVGCPYRELVDSLAAIVIFIDPQGYIRYANRHACEALGRETDQIEGRDARDLIPPISSGGEPQAGLIDDMLAAPDEHLSAEYEVRLGDGSLAWIAWARRPVRDDSGTLLGVISIGRDVTAQKRAEDALLAYQQSLRSLASELAVAEERERRQIAGRIHDDISQNLAYAKLRIESLGERELDETCTQIVAEVTELIDNAIGATRALSFDLSPPLLHELGFEAAVEWLVEQAEGREEVACDFGDDGRDKPLTDAVRVLLFQAVRELLRNIAEHADAEHAAVFLNRDDGAITISVEDDGIGFRPDEIEPGSDRFGLFAIRERLRHMGGSMTIDSTSGHGTHVVIEAPLDA